MGMFHFFAWPGLLLCLTALPYVLGKAALWVLYGTQARKLHRADAWLAGWLIGIGAVEAVHLAMIVLGRSVSDAVNLLVAVFLLLLAGAAAVLLCGRRRVRGEKGISRRSGGSNAQPVTFLWAVLVLVFFIVSVYQVVVITASGQVYRAGDLTAETVGSFISTDAFYQVNPVTGLAYEQGMPLRLKILCLPTLYAFLCKLSGLAVTEVVWKIVPLATLFGSYLAFYTLAACLFPEERDRDKRLIFMLFTAVIFCLGDYRGSMDGMGLLHSGFRGVTIRNTVLVPYTLGLVLRRKWKPVLLSVLAEVCIVWTLYGMGACVLVVALMTVVRVLTEKIVQRGTKTGEEDLV